MINDNKPSMFGHSAAFDQTNDVPRAGKSALMNEMMVDLAGKPEALSATLIGNCTTTLPMKFEIDPEDNGHTAIFAPTRSGMSVDYSVFSLTDAEIAAVKIVDRE
jgi:hypothetical protein